MISIHDQIIESLEDKLKSDGRTVILSKHKDEDELGTNERGLFLEHEYRLNGQHEADIILIGPSKKYAYAIEVKTTDYRKARKKARSQLIYDKEFIKEKLKIEKIFLFYVHGVKHLSPQYITYMHENNLGIPYAISRYIP